MRAGLPITVETCTQSLVSAAESVSEGGSLVQVCCAAAAIGQPGVVGHTDELKAPAMRTGLPITVETCTHYLVFAAESVSEGGSLVQVCCAAAAIGQPGFVGHTDV